MGSVFLPCCLTWGQTMVEVMKIMETSFRRSHALLHSVPPTLQQASCSYFCIWRCNFRKLPLFQRKDNYPNLDISDIGVSADSWFTFGSLVLAGSVGSESRWVVWLYSPWNSPGQKTGTFQGTFPTQGSNPGLPPCRQILYQLSYKERAV